MTPELAALAATALIHVTAVMWSQRALEADIGREGNIGTRENLDTRLSEPTKRLRRALANQTENTPLFLIAEFWSPSLTKAPQPQKSPLGPLSPPALSTSPPTDSLGCRGAAPSTSWGCSPASQ